jgi:nucleoid-associated protein YgaU
MPENPPTPGASSLRPDAFDRRYDPIGTPAQLGKPMPEAVKEDLSRAHPVEIRPQPEVDAAPGASASRGSGNVLIYDREVYTLRPGDSYATISNAKYGSPRYAEALALYNREQNPRLSTPVAGQSVFVPPVDILERKYGSAITGERGSSEAGRRDMATAFQPREARPGPGATSPERSFPANGLNDKRYRVRTGDTLWNIAKQTLGQGERWTEIMRMNRDVLPDINRLHDGLMLRLPVDAKVDSPPPSQ